MNRQFNRRSTLLPALPRLPYPDPDKTRQNTPLAASSAGRCPSFPHCFGPYPQHTAAFPPSTIPPAALVDLPVGPTLTALTPPTWVSDPRPYPACWMVYLPPTPPPYRVGHYYP